MVFYFSGVFSLQLFLVEDLVFFAIFCLFTIGVLLLIERKRKSIRPIYPVICLQIQGFVWCGLRLQAENKFYNEFQSSSIDSRVIYIWIVQLFSIVFALLVHIIWKCLQKIIPDHQLYKNSSSKILLLCFVVDFELIESILIICISKIIKCLINSITRIMKCLYASIPKIIKFLIVSIAGCIPMIATCLKNVLECLDNNTEIDISKISTAVNTVIIRVVVGSIVSLLFSACTALITYCFVLLVEVVSKAFSTVLGFRIFVYAIFGLFLLILFICFANVVLTSSLMPSLLNLLVRSLYLMFSSLNLLMQSLYKPSKTLFLFLVVFVPYYVITSVVLYLLVFFLPFAIMKTFHIFIGFLFFSLTIIGLFFLCKKSKNT